MYVIMIVVGWRAAVSLLMFRIVLNGEIWWGLDDEENL